MADHEAFSRFLCFFGFFSFGTVVDRFFRFEQAVVFGRFFRFKEIVFVPFVPNRCGLRVIVVCLFAAIHRKESLDVVVRRGWFGFVFCRNLFGFRLCCQAGIRGGIRCRFSLSRFNLLLVIAQLLLRAVGRSQGVVPFSGNIGHFGVAFGDGPSELCELVVVIRRVLAGFFDLAAQRFLFRFLSFDLRRNFRFFPFCVGDDAVLLGELRLEVFSSRFRLGLLIFEG